jgi:hypothetical protein
MWVINSICDLLKTAKIKKKFQVKGKVVSVHVRAASDSGVEV